MGSYGEEECFYGTNGVARPTFLPLSLKRDQFFPTLPGTPEHGAPYDAMVGITDSVVTNWELLSSSRYDVTKKFYDDNGSEVFQQNDADKSSSSCDEETVTAPPCGGGVGKKIKKKKICTRWDTATTPDYSPCCSQWLRAYISKLWMKTPAEPPPPPLSPQKPRQLTILERELTFKQISPKRLRRISRKRHGATSNFVYSAYVEDTVCELREERLQDVVYSITIRRDGSLPRNGTSPKSFSDDDIMKEKNTSRHIKGATLDFMVEKLARVFVGENEDVNFLNVFLTTYRTFASPEQLFVKLRDEYLKLKTESSTKNIQILKSIVRVFRAWLERYLLDDFQDNTNQSLLRQLHDLAKIHDDVTNANDNIPVEKKTPQKSPSPLPLRKNGMTCATGFGDYVAAKVAVSVKSNKTSDSSSSPQLSPTHSQDPTLNVLTEGANINESASKTLLSLSSRHVATQLTVIAAKLFHRVQPHHCLAAVASTKNRPQTVRATIDQFNRVVYCVVGTILCPNLSLSQRTKLLRKWIEVAQECRELKNFSSLRAIVSGLQTYALHRLKKSWLGVPQYHTNLLKELADMNMKDLLLKVGTAKVNTEDSAITKVRKEATMRRVQDMHSGIMHGTVPYLGSFLTDLTYLDTARPNFLEGGLINFEKHRKEFELLAQLQLWQASCRSYQNLDPDDEFMKWFQSITVLTEEQTFQLSECIEPPIMSPIQVTSPTRKTLAEMIHGEYERSSITPSPSWQKSKKTENGSCLKETKLSQSFSGKINHQSPAASDKNRIVKIRLVRKKEKFSDDDVMDGPNDQERIEKPIAVCEYKTISISSDERRAAVIKRALDSFMLDVKTNCKRFSLVQILQDKEIQIPDTANVFYAMSSSDQEPTLVLLEEGAEIPHKVKRHQSTPNRPKKNRHRKHNSVSHNLEPESGRASPLSPMKSLYRSLALGSVALVGGASYSPTETPRRQSDREGEVAGNDGIVLINTRSGVGFDDGAETAGKEGTDNTVCRPSPGQMHSSRCHSVDFTNGVVLPVRVVRSSIAISASSPKLSNSAPTSPRRDRKSVSSNSEEPPFSPDAKIINATGRLIEWPRYSRSIPTQSGRSGTWSSRRALRKPKKNRSFSTFYVNKATGEVQQPPSPPSRSKFYVDINNSPPLDRPTKLFHKSHSSVTLPPRLVPDFSGHDYDVTKDFQTSISTDETKIPQIWEDPSVRRSNSFASVASTQSQDTTQNSDTGSGINFSVATSEDNVFQEGEKLAPTPPTSKKLTEDPSKTPAIRIQCASPDDLLDESGFFERYAGAHSESDSQDEGRENEKDESTYL